MCNEQNVKILNKSTISILELKPQNIYVPIHSGTPIASLQGQWVGHRDDARQGGCNYSLRAPLRRLWWSSPELAALGMIL